MKKNIFSIMLLVIFFSSACSQKIIGKRELKQFEYHFNILDSVARSTLNDTLTNVTNSIAFMEEKTGIEASTDGTWVGRLACTKNDLDKWHEWYDKRYKKN